MAEQAPFKELMRRYFLGLLSPEEKERFAGLLRESIENRRAFLREAQITSVIHEWAIQQLSEPEPGSPKPAPSTKSLRSRGTPEKKGKRLWKPLGVAASLLLAILAAVFLRKDEVPSPVARLESLRGKVLLVPGRSPAAQGQDLLGGQGLETVGQGSRAGLVFSDATRLELGPDGALPQIEDRDSGKRVSLGKGTLVANVARQPAGHPMVFTTPQGEARVLGTTLRILVDPDPKMGTRLEVEEGKVQLKNLAGKTVDVVSGHFAVAAPGTELLARPMAPPSETPKMTPGAALVGKMPPNSWISVPDTHLRKVVPDPGQYPRIQGTMGPRGIMTSWSGGALDSARNRLIVWGGGSTNYRGNELYAFDLLALRWERLTDPTPDPVDGGTVNRDGTPNARDTFNGLAYVAHADRFFAMGGSLSGTKAQFGADTPWTFDFSSHRWIDPKPAGIQPRTGEGDNCAYDPATRKVWYLASNGQGGFGLYSYDVDANRWTKHTEDYLPNHTCAVDPRRGLLVAVGLGEVVTFDLRGALTRQLWKTSGGDALVAIRAPGLDYDPRRDRLVGWAGGSVYSLDLETKAWTPSDAPGAPAPTPNGIYGRWRYVPSLDVFVVATNIDENVHLYKPGK